MCQELFLGVGDTTVDNTVTTLVKTLTLLNNIYQICIKCQLLGYVIPLHIFYHIFLTTVWVDKITTSSFQMRTWGLSRSSNLPKEGDGTQILTQAQ